MKKAISILLAICISFSLVSVSAFAEYSTPQEIKLNFDYNGDGVVNLSDARTVLRVSANLEAPKDGLIYDIVGNGDGLTMEDVKKVISIVTGIDTEVNECAEFNLELFKAELDNVKSTRPGFTKTTTTKCHSMRVTTRNAPFSELNVTDLEFSQYAEKTCSFLEKNYGFLLNAEMKAEIAALRKQAKEMYDLKTTVKTVNKYSTHLYHFPINANINSCLLKIDDIKSIECYEEDGYIIRKVTMNDETYIGDEFPSGNEGASQRLKVVSYAKVFNIPDFDETEGTKKTSTLNSVTFKNGVIISKVDKLSGIPVSVDYSYDYVASVSAEPTVDQNGNKGIEMDSVSSATNTEHCDINPLTKN